MGKWLCAVMAMGMSLAGQALAESKTYGVGLSGRIGIFDNVAGGGAEVNARASKAELIGGYFSSRASGAHVGAAPEEGYAQNDAYAETAVYAALRYHPADGSFFLGVGGSKSKLTAGTTVTQPAGGTVLDERMQLERVMTTFSIGNAWTFDDILLTIDWLGFQWQDSSKETDTSKVAVTDSALSPAQSKFYSDLRTSRKTTVTFLYIGLGIMLGH